MNRLFIIFSLILWAFIGLLASCQSPVASITPTPSPSVSPSPTPVIKYVSVLNSEWKVVKQEVKANIASRAIEDTSAIKSEVDAYNAAHIDDQWFMYDGDYPDLENAPPAKIYIVDKITHEPLIDASGNALSYDSWPRKQFVDNKAGWKKYAEMCGADMYIDVIPPAPIPVVLTVDQIHQKYSIYVINKFGAIKYERHCELEWNTTDWPMYTLDTYYALIVRTLTTQIQLDSQEPDAPYEMRTNQIYVAP